MWQPFHFAEVNERRMSFGICLGASSSSFLFFFPFFFDSHSTRFQELLSTMGDYTGWDGEQADLQRRLSSSFGKSSTRLIFLSLKSLPRVWDRNSDHSRERSWGGVPRDLRPEA